MSTSTIATLETAAIADHPAGRFAGVIAWIVRYNELVLALLGGVLLVTGWVTYLNDGPHVWRVTLLGLSAIVTSTRTLPEAVESLGTLRLNIDVLMFVAAGGAASLGHYEEGAFLLFLFGLGSAGEHLAVGRARRAIEALSSLAPDTANVIDDSGEIIAREVETIDVGTMILVRPFDRIALDGEITEGQSAIDESMLTGESIPVEKAVGDTVFAGTMNSSGTIRVRVTKASSDTTLARIMTLVQEAQEGRSATQRFTDRVESWYVPMVFVMTILLLTIPPMLFEQSWSMWFIRSMAFMTAASPCALAIGTPAAILCGIARSAQLGVLVKGGEYLESLGKIDAIAFDKTGTLTQGKPAVVGITTIADAQGAPLATEDDVLALAAAVDQEITHPLAVAIVKAARARGLTLPNVKSVEQLPGVGAQGDVDGMHIKVVKPAAVPEDRWPAALRDDATARGERGETIVLVVRDDEPIGVIGLADRVRDEARGIIERLRKIGIREQVMLTGDHPGTARAVAAQLGIDHVYADLTPDDKLTKIDELRERHHGVAMIGDGVNDAPALARATVGIAMGAAGADVALETADIAIMGSSLGRLPDAIGLSRAARRIIAQNLFIALGVITVVAPLGALGIAELGVAVLLHEGSTIVVVLNALRLLAYRAE